jgi:hypothetical protein
MIIEVMVVKIDGMAQAKRLPALYYIYSYLQDLNDRRYMHVNNYKDSS